VLEGGTAKRSPATVNRYLAGVFAFYDHQARCGVEVDQSLMAWRRVQRGSYCPFLHHVSAGRPVRTRPVKLRVPRLSPKVLEPGQVAAVIGACEHLRGRAKCREPAVIPVPTSLVRLYSEYMHTEYGDLDSDYVFVSLWSEPLGAPLRYDAVSKLVARLRARTGLDFTVHLLRHTHATDLLRAGVPIEVVAKLLTHRSSVTTSQTYIHLTPEDLRAELARAGFGDRGAR